MSDKRADCDAHSDLALPDPVLRALGRLSWVAVHLEDWANASCELVLEEWDEHKFISPYIRKAIKRAQTWELSWSVVEAIEWFEEALALIETRNQILHSLPVTVHGEPAFVYIYKEKDGVRPPGEQRMLRADVIDPIADEFEALLRRWQWVHSALNIGLENHKRQQAE